VAWRHGTAGNSDRRLPGDAQLAYEVAVVKSSAVHATVRSGEDQKWNHSVNRAVRSRDYYYDEARARATGLQRLGDLQKHPLQSLGIAREPKRTGKETVNRDVLRALETFRNHAMDRAPVSSRSTCVSRKRLQCGHQDHCGNRAALRTSGMPSSPSRNVTVSPTSCFQTRPIIPFRRAWNSGRVC